MRMLPVFMWNCNQGLPLRWRVVIVMEQTNWMKNAKQNGWNAKQNGWKTPNKMDEKRQTKWIKNAKQNGSVLSIGIMRMLPVFMWNCNQGLPLRWRVVIVMEQTKWMKNAKQNGLKTPNKMDRCYYRDQCSRWAFFPRVTFRTAVIIRLRLSHPFCSFHHYAAWHAW